MSKKALERVFGPDWREALRRLRWESEHRAVERHKRLAARPGKKEPSQ